MERACRSLRNDNQVQLSITQPISDQASNSCVSFYISNQNQSDPYLVNATNSTTFNLMIVAAFASGIVSLLSYFLIWKPLLNKCRGLSLFLPPVCMICQSLLLQYAQTIDDFNTYEYTLLSSTLVPSLHCNFQGVMLLLFNMSDVPPVKTKQEIMNTKLEGSHMVIIMAILFGGCFMITFPDLGYNLIFFIQVALGCACIMYAFTLLPGNCACMSGLVEERVKDEDSIEKIDDLYNNICSDDSLNLSSEDDALEDMMKTRIRRRKLIKQVDLIPMFFSETSYKKEWIIVIEVCLFTVAMVCDTSISGPYLVQHPFSFDVKLFGYCIVAQGLIKMFGMFLIKFTLHFSQVKHGSLICIAALNQIGYYIALAFAGTKSSVIATMFSNIFGGLAFPALFSFIKLNLRDTLDAVVELSIVSSLVVTMSVNALEYFIYQKTRSFFPGIIFLLTAAVIAFSILIILATYITTKMKTKRKTKYYADNMLNSTH